MYGILLRLDSGRQMRVGTDPLAKLLKPEVYKAITSRRTSMNASLATTSPFAPTLIRPSFYPEYFRATDIRTLYWKVKNHPELHSLLRVLVDENSRICFVFSVSGKEVSDALSEVLMSYGHFEFLDPKIDNDTVSYKVQTDAYQSYPSGMREISENVGR